MKIVADDKIPYLKGAFEPFAEVVYLPGGKISPADLADADALPTWVNRPKTNGVADFYHILPLDPTTKDQWTTLYGLTPEQYTAAQESYSRTMTILSPGLTECQTWLTQQNTNRTS